MRAYVRNAVAFLTVLAIACTPSAPSAPASSAQKPAGAAGGGSANAEWERAVAGAKQEGKVNVVGPAGDVIRTKMVEAFQTAYPDITMDWQGGRNTDMATKMDSERRAGVYNVDVFLGGTSTALRLVRPTGALAPVKPVLLLPEVTDPKNWFGGKLEFSDKEELNLVFITVPTEIVSFNNELVKAEEVDELEELVDPKWKGKLAINDPIPTGAGNVVFRFFWQALGPQKGAEYIKALRAQAGAVSRDERAQVEWIARNRYPVVVGSSGLAQQQLIDIRDRVGTVVQMKTYGGLVTASSGSVMMIDKPPHPNAATVFANWLLSKDGQTAWSTALNQPSRRLDVPTSHLPAYMIPKANEKYWLSYTEENVDIPADLGALLTEQFSN